jgi:hypothetical protein
VSGPATFTNIELGDLAKLMREIACFADDAGENRESLAWRLADFLEAASDIGGMMLVDVELRAGKAVEQ